MHSAKKPIIYDFQSGSVLSATIRERMGLSLMKLAAFATYPVSYVGFSYAARLIRNIIPGSNPVKTTLYADTVFEFPYGDAYWGRLLNNRQVYSPDIEHFLLAIRDTDYLFVDCGANYGYMSAIITSDRFGNKPAMAIEAAPETFEILKRNASNNHDRFDIRHRAVFSKSGETANIYGEKHEARSILADKGEKSKGTVETLALNDLRPWIDAHGGKPVLLKLDVEGVEIDAMKGASGLQEYQMLVIFEDHGCEKTHQVTRFFMEDLNMKVYVSEKSGCREIRNISELNRIKNNPRVGYDFIASNSKFWLEKISTCKYHN